MQAQKILEFQERFAAFESNQSIATLSCAADITSSNVATTLEISAAWEALHRAELETTAAANAAREERRLRLDAEQKLADCQSASFILSEYIHLITTESEVAAAKEYIQDQLKSEARNLQMFVTDSPRLTKYQEVRKYPPQKDSSILNATMFCALENISAELQALFNESSAMAATAHEERSRSQRAQATLDFAGTVNLSVLEGLNEALCMVETISASVATEHRALSNAEYAQESVYLLSCVHQCETLAASAQKALHSASSMATAQRLTLERATTELLQACTVIRAETGTHLRNATIEAVDWKQLHTATVAVASQKVAQREVLLQVLMILKDHIP